MVHHKIMDICCFYSMRHRNQFDTQNEYNLRFRHWDQAQRGSSRWDGHCHRPLRSLRSPPERRRLPPELPRSLQLDRCSYFLVGSLCFNRWRRDVMFRLID